MNKNLIKNNKNKSGFPNFVLVNCNIIDDDDELYLVSKMPKISSATLSKMPIISSATRKGGKNKKKQRTKKYMKKRRTTKKYKRKKKSLRV